MLEQYPYVPQMDHCGLTLQREEATCHIMDHCCRDVTGEERAELDRAVLRLARQAAFLDGPDLADPAIDEAARIG